MTFRLVLLCSFILLARPQDALPFLQPVRPALVVTLLAMGALVFGSHRQRLVMALSTTETKRYLLFFLIMLAGYVYVWRKGVFDWGHER